MEIEEKIKVILEAHSKGLSGRKLSPESKGGYLTKLKKGTWRGKVSEKRIDRMYQASLSYLQQGEFKGKWGARKEKKIVEKPIEKEVEKVSREATDMQKILERLDRVEEENKQLRGMIEKMTTTTGTREKAEKIHGCILNKRKTGGNALYWYAGKTIDGKMSWCYVGKDKAQAEEKIKAKWGQ